MNVPVFLIGLLAASAGGVGFLLWGRLSGFGNPAPDSVTLGFDEAGDYAARELATGTMAYDEDFAPSTTIGHRLLSLGGIVAFILVVSLVLALAVFIAGKAGVSMIERFIETSPAPLP